METLKRIARIQSDFPTKFGIPRQSGVVEGLKAAVVFEPEYRSAEALRGLEDFSHIWLIWGFSQVGQAAWRPTVRPPRLGGNARMGVFATRSPYRPNPIGISPVRVERIEPHTAQGPVIHVLGADLMDGTPIYDIKPYLPYVDCIPGAAGGFAGDAPAAGLRVEMEERWALVLGEERARLLKEVLAQDVRPAYQDEAGRVYGMQFAGFEVKFRVRGGVVRVCGAEKL